MNSIESLKDYLIADEIKRIESLSREKLISELVAVKSEMIESFTDLKEIREYGN
jgi:hypothetical protein